MIRKKQEMSLRPCQDAGEKQKIYFSRTAMSGMGISKLHLHQYVLPRTKPHGKITLGTSAWTFSTNDCAVDSDNGLLTST